MRRQTSNPSRLAAVGLTLLAVANVAACMDGSNPTRELVTSISGGPRMAETPDFVQRSRPASLDYLPIGVDPPARPTPARTAEEIKAAEAEMEAVRARNEAAGAAAARLGGTPPPEPVILPRKPNSRTTR